MSSNSTMFVSFSTFRGPFFRDPGKMVPESRKNAPQKNGPRKNGPQEKWSPGKMVPGKMSFKKSNSTMFVRFSTFRESRKNGPWKMVPGKNGPRKIGPSKNVLQKLFPVKRMLGNLNDFFIFIDLLHCTHKKIIDVYLTILHMHQTVEHWRSPGRFVVEFWDFLNWSHPNIPHTCYDARSSPQYFLFRVLGLFPSFVFVVEFWVYIDWSHLNIPHTHHDPRRSPHDFLSLSFQGTNFSGTIFPGTNFCGGHFSRNQFS